MKCILTVQILVTTAIITLCEGLCNFTEIHLTASACLTGSNVAPGTEILFPVLEDHAAVINFCTNLTDIKTCVRHALSACSPSFPLIQMIFGQNGAPLLAAYDGVCSEATKVEALTCAYHHAVYISSAAEVFFRDMDELGQTNKFNACFPLHTFHMHALTFVEDAVHSNHCSQQSHMIMEKFLQTIEFRCKDIATSYYPCTVAKIHSNAVACFAASSVTVRNGFVPAPGLAHADVMCSSKGTILNCIHNHLGQCLNEEQVTVVGMGKEYAAAYECMCSLNNADMVLSCPSTADTNTAMNKFLEDVHSTILEGHHEKESICTKLMVMKSRMINAINNVCLGETDRMYWNTFLSTIAYPCTEEATACYPHMGSGSDPKIKITRTLRTSIISFSFFGIFMLYSLYIH